MTLTALKQKERILAKSKLLRVICLLIVCFACLLALTGHAAIKECAHTSLECLAVTVLDKLLEGIF